MKWAWLLILSLIAGCDRPASNVTVDNKPNPALTAAFCVSEAGEKRFGNTKTCAMQACEKGDKASCDIARDFAQQLGPDDGAAMPAKPPAKLEGLDYNEARRFILSLGWRPFAGECQGAALDSGTCRRFPEIDNCSGTGMGFCDMRFVRGERCLLLVTVGGQPDGVVDGEPSVRDVTFSRAPCVSSSDEN